MKVCAIFNLLCRGVAGVAFFGNMGYLKQLVLNTFTDRIITELHVIDILMVTLLSQIDACLVIIVDRSGCGVGK